MEQRKGPPIGIDLGNAYIRAAVSDGTNCRVIPDDHGNSAMPSYVAFTNSRLLIGEAARVQAPDNPANTIFHVLRLMGRCYYHRSVHNDMRLWPFKVIADPDNKMLQVEVNWKGKLWQFKPVEICAMLLIQIKKNAEKNLGTTVTDAVITVPVCFKHAQRLEIKQAGIIAGLNFIQIVNAPAASAFFHSLERSSKSNNIISHISRSIKEHNMVIFDLGAGTLDVAVVTIKKNVCRVRATAGDAYLGGSDFDNNLMDYFLKGKEYLITIPTVRSKLRAFCEESKISLSSGNSVVDTFSLNPKQNYYIDPIYVTFDCSINQETFFELNSDIFMKCLQILDTCLEDSKINVNAIHEVILAGSSAYWVKYNIQGYFKKQVTNVTIIEHVEAATAYGAACQAFFLSRRQNGKSPPLSLLDVAPLPFALNSTQLGFSVLVPKNMNIPVRIVEKMSVVELLLSPIEIYEVERMEDGPENNFIGKCHLTDGHASFSSISCDINVIFDILESWTLTITIEEIPHGKGKFTIFTNNNIIKIDDSLIRVREAFYKESGKNDDKASIIKSLTIKDTSCKSDKARDTKPNKQHVEPKEYTIGIDFGTTHSSVAVWRSNGVEIIKNEYGSQLTSSVVAFTDTCRLIGDTVHKEQFATSPANTISNIKRLIGRLYSDQLVQNDNTFLPFRVLCGDKNRPMISVQYKNEEKLFAPEEIAAMILSKMKEIAETHLDSMVTKAVISVPASFSDSQRKAIKDAGAIAGLNVMQLLNEPSATAIAYFLQTYSGQSSTEKTLLIFDLGGGNLDVSIVNIKEGSIKVQAVSGDTKLGGEDFDNNMVSYFVEKFLKEKKMDIRNKSRSLRRLRAACEKAKRVLSSYTQAVVEVHALDEGVDFDSCITRKTFEEINAVLFHRCISCVERCLEDAKTDKSCIDEVVLVGGSTKIPNMLQLLQEFFNGKELCRSVNTDEAVVYGAAAQAAILSGNLEREEFNKLELQDVTSLSLGMGKEDGGMMNLLIRKHTPIPATKELIFTNYTDGLSSFSIQVQECELRSTLVYSLSSIKPKSSGQSEVIVSFEVDDSGILNLTAKDMTTGKKNEIEINKENRGLTTKEIQTMIEAAARYKAQDEEHKNRAAALQSLQNFAYELKDIAKDAGVSTASKKSVEKAADNAITWLETNYNAAIDEISAQRKELETIKSQIVYLGADASLQ